MLEPVLDSNDTALGQCSVVRVIARARVYVNKPSIPIEIAQLEERADTNLKVLFQKYSGLVNRKWMIYNMIMLNYRLGKLYRIRSNLVV
ncbi:hypothetical protein EVAR_98789_1 [Eumeta japonica]|uniref:Uncharacterized protein n=1 Tax=Eumeta variegata TaxID=151549 RepID=A0A4C2A2C2_EUMVA|nr:hypothetical protein EVAR_98789_1 [Eumeta japonica]